MKRLALGLVLVCGWSCGPKQAGTDAPDMSSAASLEVSSSAFKNGETIPEKFGGYGQATPVELHWGKVPTGTKSIAVMVEDPDAPGLSPFVHWLVTNLPATATSTAEKGDVQPNSAGEAGFYPPKPPAGSVHQYHFEVFALDVPQVKAHDRDGFLNEIKGHVLAKGELVGLYAKPG